MTKGPNPEFGAARTRMQFITHGPEETIDLGRQIGAALLPNDVLALSGQLGAGKTTLIQGIAAGAGVADYVTSPTFIIINEYSGRLPFYHIDLYRMERAEDIEELGIEEYFRRGGACVIEWAEKLDSLLPGKTEKIDIGMINENEREIWLSSGLAARLK